jgi:hypothetical protein
MNGIYVATPCYGNQVYADYMMDIMELQRACQERHINFDILLLGKDALITRARNTCVGEFLDSGFSHLLFIDADMSFAPWQAFRLFDSGYDVACTMYPVKTLLWDKVATCESRDPASLELSALRFAYNPSRQKTSSDGFEIVTNAGTAFMMIKREVLLSMISAYSHLAYKPNFFENNQTKSLLYPLFDTMIDTETQTYLSEDYAFCKRWTALGGKIHLDTRSIIVHIGNYEHGRKAQKALSDPGG